ncbi:MAG TPA: nicotinate-nicotinamide nucleotide adenylyltransferase [Planktothrix sp.]|jgi:nicotinate-nucleotide adenylyltransferase
MAKKNDSLREHLGRTLYGRPLQRRPRIAIYQGSFEIHYGHLLCAQWVRFTKNIDKVLFCTVGKSPNKQYSLPAEDRHELVVAATAANPFFEASRIDIDQKGVSFMNDTVQEVLRRYGTDIDLSVLISSEYMNPDFEYFLPRWTGAKEMFAVKNLTFLVFPRDGITVEQIEKWAGLIPEARIEALHAPSPPLSSSMIRQWVSQGRSIWYTTPWCVQQLMNKKRHFLPPGQEPYKHEPVPLSEVKEIGIYPGAFDPIHYGDLLRAEWARQEHKLDRVIFVPSATPPNNQKVFASAEDRFEMAVAATADNPFFDVWRTEIESGKAVSYTLPTVMEARRKFGENVGLSVLLASKYLDPKNPHHLSTWMGAEELFKLCKFIVFPRDWSEIEQVNRWAKRVPNASIEVVYAPKQPLDSEDLRDMVAKGFPLQYTTPFDVQQTIYKKGLYGAEAANVARKKRNSAGKSASAKKSAAKKSAAKKKPQKTSSAEATKTRK